MFLESPSSVESDTVKMLAILEKLEGDTHTDNTVKYLYLLLFKFGLDAAVFILCPKRFTSFLSLFSLSITLADLVMVFLMAAVWFLGPESAFLSPCFLLANASTTYGALPLPVMCLSFLDYCLGGTWISNHSAFSKVFRNVVVMLLVWAQAVFYSFGSVNTELFEVDDATGMKVLVCAVDESMLITYFVVGVFTAVIFILLPFWSNVVQWAKEAQRMFEALVEQEKVRSDLFAVICHTKTKKREETDVEEMTQPPLWFSLTMGFGTFWMPYLTVCVSCMILDLRLPAYLAVNLLWLECTNSLLVGLVFWIKSKTQGPYSHLPENICLWHVYWQLSKGIQQRQYPVPVYNPSN